jgi:hypothetical protein
VPLPPAPLERPGGLSDSNWEAADPFPRGFPLQPAFAAFVRARVAAQEQHRQLQHGKQAAALVHAARADE